MHISRFSAITEPLLKIQQQITTLKRINRPADDPPSHGQVLRYDKRLFEVDQHLANIKSADFYMSSTESVLQQIQEQLSEARRLATQGANATSSEALATAAIEVEGIYARLMALSNTYTGGRFIFAGHHERTSPFAMRGGVARSFVGSDLGYVGGVIAAPITIDANNNQLTLTTRGGTFSNVTIAEGVYTTGAELAAALQSAIDNAPEFRGAGRLLSVTFENNRLVIRSTLDYPQSSVSPSPADPPVSAEGMSVIAAGGTAGSILGLGAGTNSPNVVLIGTGAAANNQITVSIDGKVQKLVTIPAATYSSGTALASAVESAINSDPSVAAANVTVAVTYDADHRLVITSDSTDPAASSVFVLGGLSNVLGLVGGSNLPVIEYTGDGGEIPVIIGPRTTGVGATLTTVISNIPGDRLFQNANGGSHILEAVGGLQGALETGNRSGIQRAIYELDFAQKQVSHEESLLGARRNTVDLNRTILEDFKTYTSGFRSDLQDTDYAKAMSELTGYMNALEAAVAVESIALKDMSLLEFLE
jgi:flagellin-like hook-associated protein FlgL